jgi:ubiquinol-cytochrome c reductase cytochrome c1 subunit
MSSSIFKTFRSQVKNANTSSKILSVLIAAASAAYVSTSKVFASSYVEECLPAPKFPWEHQKLHKSFDHMAIRRGFIVYNTIGAACHSMNFRYYRQLIDVAFTEEEVKAIAAEYDDYLSEPNEEGDVNPRKGVINDRMHAPYSNDMVARAANNGALPPDLSQIVRARDGGESYLFALLTGYRDAPHGVTLGENMNYNIYFPGTQIAMPAPLAEDAVEYEDGTRASISQQAKDVSVYLAWSSFMELDERHLMGIKSIFNIVALTVGIWWWKRFRWSYVKKRKVAFLRRIKDI